jgi:hypothetical protein
LRGEQLLRSDEENRANGPSPPQRGRLPKASECVQPGNRTGTDTGLRFPDGTYEPGPQYEFPPIKVNLYGKFTVNLGVFVREVHEQLTGQPVPRFVPEYVCELRKRLPELLPAADRPITEKGVGWWSLDDPPLKTANEIRRLTMDYAFPFFEIVKTRDGVIDLWKRDRFQKHVWKLPG